MLNSIYSKASQSSGLRLSGARSVPSNAMSSTFVNGQAGTIFSSAPLGASQACPLLHRVQAALNF